MEKVLVNYWGPYGIGKTELLKEYIHICQEKSPAFLAMTINLIDYYIVDPEYPEIEQFDKQVKERILGNFEANSQQYKDDSCGQNTFTEEVLCLGSNREQAFIDHIVTQKGIICIDSMERASSDLLDWFEKVLFRPILQYNSKLAIFIGSRSPIYFRDPYLKRFVKNHLLPCFELADSERLINSPERDLLLRIYDTTEGHPLFDGIFGKALKEMEAAEGITITHENFTVYLPKLLLSFVRPLIHNRAFDHVSDEIKYTYLKLYPLRKIDPDLILYLLPYLGKPGNRVFASEILPKLEQAGLVTYNEEQNHLYESNYVIRRLLSLDCKYNNPQDFYQITNQLIGYYEKKLSEGLNDIDLCEWAYHYSQGESVKKKAYSDIEKSLAKRLHEIIDNNPNIVTYSHITNVLSEDREFRMLFQDDGVILFNELDQKSTPSVEKKYKLDYFVNIQIENLDGSSDQRIKSIAYQSAQKPRENLKCEKALHHALPGQRTNHILRQYYDCLNQISNSTSSDQENQRHYEGLKIVGRSIYTNYLHPSIQKSLEKIPAGSSILIESNNSIIPWELLHDGESFIGLKYNVSYSGYVGQTKNYTTNRPSVLLIENAIGDLQKVREEVQKIKDELNNNHFQVTLLSGNSASLENVISHISQNTYSLIHFVGRVRYQSNSSANTGLVLHQNNLLSIEKLQKIRIIGEPIVFLNAYEIIKNGRFLLTNYTNTFAKDLFTSFIRRGASTCLGAIIHSEKVDNRSITYNYYSHLLNSETAGYSLMKIKEDLAIRQKSINWLPYFLYGNPNQLLAPGRSS